MVRLIFLAALLVLAVIDYRKPVRLRYFTLAFAALTLLLVLRCGQGIDYFNYSAIYKHIGLPTEIKTEPGFRFFMLLCIKAGWDFPVFAVLIGFVSMGLLYFFIVKYSECRCISLLVVYTIYYMSYFESGIRQNLAMLICCAVVIPALLMRRTAGNLMAILGIAAAATIHTSALVAVLFIIPCFFTEDAIRRLFKDRTYLFYLSITLICVLLCIFSVTFGLKGVISILPEAIQSRLTKYVALHTYSMSALMGRIAFVGLASVLYYFTRTKHTRTDQYLYHLYLLGFIVYCALFSSYTIASRIHAYFRMADIILFANLMRKCSLPVPAGLPQKIKSVWSLFRKALPLCVLLCLLMGYYFKDIHSTRRLSNYRGDSYFYYPYFTYFNIDKMPQYRDPPFSINWQREESALEYYEYTGTYPPSENPADTP